MTKQSKMPLLSLLLLFGADDDDDFEVLGAGADGVLLFVFSTFFSSMKNFIFGTSLSSLDLLRRSVDEDRTVVLDDVDVDLGNPSGENA